MTNTDVVNHFLITYCRKLNENDFEWKDDIHAGIKGKRAFLNHEKNVEFLNLLENYFETKVNVPRVKHGNKQELESVINEEAMLLASFIRGKRIWEPRSVPLPNFVMPRIFVTKRKAKALLQPFFPRLEH